MVHQYKNYIFKGSAHRCAWLSIDKKSFEGNPSRLNFNEVRLSKHFRQRALERFGITKDMLDDWLANVYKNLFFDRKQGKGYYYRNGTITMIASIEADGTSTWLTCYNSFSEDVGILNQAFKSLNSNVRNNLYGSIELQLGRTYRDNAKKLSGYYKQCYEILSKTAKTTQLKVIEKQIKTVKNIENKIGYIEKENTKLEKLVSSKDMSKTDFSHMEEEKLND